MKRLSVVIANYNYEQYVASAIESALALRWDDVEIVVVDDGSTDGSVEVIRRYADRATVLFTGNSKQRVAVNRGYAETTGDVVVFLDSDDVLPADLPSRLAKVWSPTVSKAQFQMQRIAADGQPIGEPFPAYSPVPSPGDIRRWVLRTSAYPTPPGSGNAYARAFLDRIFPLDASIGDFADSGCLAAAPLLGDVVSVPGVIVGYRQHSANDSDLLWEVQRFPREVARARARWHFAQMAHGASANEVDDRPLFRSRELLQFRVATLRIGASSEQPLPGDTPARLFRDIVRSPFQVGPETLAQRIVIAGWCLVTALAPQRFVRQLLALRYGRARPTSTTDQVYTRTQST